MRVASDTGGVQSPTSPEIAFPSFDDQRPSTPTVRGVLADAVRDVDLPLADEIDRSSSWRSDYVSLVGRATAASARTPKAALAMAQAGLRAVHERMVVADGSSEVRLRDWDADGLPLATRTVSGSAPRVPELRVPYQGRSLSGGALRDQLARWQADGIVEPSFVEAVSEVVDHPEWLALGGRTLVLLGAGAEMSPLGPLCAWGADVLAVDVPVDRVWERILGIAESGAGTVAYPVVGDAPGADLVARTAEVLAWLRQARDVRGEGSLAVGMYAYADGGAHVRVTAAVDAIVARLTEEDPQTAIAYLATPTDAFVVPADVVAAGTQAFDARGPVRWLQAPLRTASRGRLFLPNYATVLPDGSGVADILVPQQGPNYAMAKRIQRWRGVVAEDAGQRVSFNVAPATWTRSVTKNRLLAAAYAGAHHFGVEIFPPETTRTLMAALLVRDLHRPVPRREHPEELFADAAAHGGLWRVGYEPRSALGVAAVAGLPSTLRRR